MSDFQGEFPENNQEINELEEERRLFYVAMTRAKDNLYILYPEKHYDKAEKLLSLRGRVQSSVPRMSCMTWASLFPSLDLSVAT